jgi:hypothetical protein
VLVLVQPVQPENKNTTHSESAGTALPLQARDSVRSSYETRVSVAKATKADLDRKSSRVSAARLLLAIAAFSTIVAMVWGPLPETAWLLVVACIVAFVVLVVVHARLRESESRALATLTFFERGLKRLTGEWKKIPYHSTAAPAATHPYADDLDIVGEGSLLHLIDTTATRFGGKRLAEMALAPAVDPVASGRKQQEAVRELSANLEFREQLFVLGSLATAEKSDPAAFIDWTESPEPPRLSPALRVAAFGLPLASAILFGYAKLGGLTRPLYLAPFAIAFVLSLLLSGRLAETFRALDSQRGLVNFAELLRKIEQTTFRASQLLRAHAAFTGVRTAERKSGATRSVDRDRDRGSASERMQRLSRIVSFAEARQNDFFRLFIGPLLLWDVHVAFALEGVRDDLRGCLRDWFEAVGEIEALASLATFAAENPEFSWPTWVAPIATDKPLPKFAATSLAHPLLAREQRVANDLVLDRSLVITGSNMAGKSTLLRTIGCNIVLAYLGAPVCAESMTLGALRIATSMRVRDSVGDGVSRFYAELQKLAVVLEIARAGRETGAPYGLFLLDEILHGTNARERLIGARSFLRELLVAGAVGAVSTHDLELAELEADWSQALRNVHFEEQVENERMTFDYKLREGVVQSSNALRLMRLVGIDI